MWGEEEEMTKRKLWVCRHAMGRFRQTRWLPLARQAAVEHVMSPPSLLPVPVHWSHGPTNRKLMRMSGRHRRDVRLPTGVWQARADFNVTPDATHMPVQYGMKWMDRFIRSNSRIVFVYGQ